MAIVTRRYLYEGPPLDEIRSQTDPGLTVATTELKLAFDATFDDEAADVTAVDQAMASSGLVPDPGAVTTAPPLFPNGGFSPTTILTSDQTIEVNAAARVDTSGGPVAITLPPAFNNRGLSVIVKDVGNNASVNNITVLPSGGGSDTVDGGASQLLRVNRGALALTSDGVSDWMITARA